MKSVVLTISALSVLTLAGCTEPPEPLSPNERLGSLGERAAVVYEVRALPTLGGPESRGNSINNRGQIAGHARLPGGEAVRATLWREGEAVDLGTLGGLNSSVAWTGQNNTGMVVGIAETAEPDTLGQSWSCSFFFPTVTGNTCRGFVLEASAMTALPTLGGDNGYATSANDRGQVVGWAETPVHDPTCNEPQVLQFRAVMWEPKQDRVQELPPLPGDSTSAATAINNRGQAVGISGQCDIAVGRFSAVHAVLWEKGTVTDLGSLGGAVWNTPTDINDRGDVVGFSNLDDDEDGSFNAQAFLWTRQGGIQKLGTLPGDAFSQAQGINARGQVVGISSGGANGSRAFIWQSGAMTDLNTLLAPGTAYTLVDARNINDAGEITGQAVHPETGDRVAFVATPVRRIR